MTGTRPAEGGAQHALAFVGGEGVILASAAQRNQAVKAGANEVIRKIGHAREINFLVGLHGRDRGGEDAVEGFAGGCSMGGFHSDPNCAQMVFNSVYW